MSTKEYDTERKKKHISQNWGTKLRRKNALEEKGYGIHTYCPSKGYVFTIVFTLDEVSPSFDFRNIFWGLRDKKTAIVQRAQK